ncbi:SusC/RagA family TonB-linked outer membrane protein [Phocaeicola massiliensis]|uniref:SusC/RagA family TonB-linked outer membrane protein n=4 Tax=Phocaeicola massiliensis TaxID=204516 RepID=UPI0022E57673|nr:TonB-dependent receptor [Phocaeicola massiliensis]
MKRKFMLLLTCLFIGIGLVTAQVTKVTGTVISEEDGLPVVGASILVKGTAVGTVTDMDGKFQLPNVPSSANSSAKTLVISFIGMENKEVPIKPSVKVTLKPMTELLSEVLVTGTYGSAKKLGSMVGSVAAVKSEKIANRPSANFADALQGQVAGLQVFTSSGEPSEGVSMRLRGIGSINSSSEPLFILDGAPISSGAFSAINPNDIENLTILKDASSTSIYGSRAANGVIVITTKRGKGVKPTVTIKGQYGISQRAVENITLMNSEQYFNFCETVNPNYKTNEAFQANKEFALKHGISTDWYDYFFKDNAPTYQLDASITGVANNTNYFISASHYDAEGIEPASGMKRETVRSNIDTKVSDWFRVGLNLGLSYEDFETNGFAGTGNSWYNVATLSKWAIPYETPYEIIENADGSISYGKRKNILDKIGLWNPYYLLENQPTEKNKIRLYGNAFEEITPIKGLTIRAAQAIDAFDYRYRYVSLPADYNNQKGSASESFQRYSSFTFTNTAEYKFSINEMHNISALVGQESIIYNGSSFGASVDNITDGRLPMLSNGTIPKQPSASKKKKVMNSYFSRLEYNFGEKYFFDASFRTDGSSIFGRDNRWASFFSVGTMWNVSKEAFMEDIDWLKDLKVKFSYGTTGNSAFDGDPYYPSLGLVGTGKYNGDQTFYISSVQNDGLTWEKQKTINIGLSARLFDRLDIDLAYYDKKTTDMLMTIPYSYTTGHSSGWGNIGSMFNRGFEATVSYDIINRRNLQWSVSANINYNKNQITELFGGRDEYVVANTGIKYQVGMPYGELYYVRWVGVDPADGQQIWLDKDGNETKTYSEDNAVFTGKQRYAPWAGGFSTSFFWKGFSINADFSYVLGKYTINNDAFFYNNPNFAGQLNQSTDMLDMWTTPGQVTNIPAANSELRFDTHLIENASFLRLKNLTIGYTLPENWLHKTGFIKGARIFAVGRNLLTVTNYTGADPEVDSNLQLGKYPNTKQFTIGAELTF